MATYLEQCVQVVLSSPALCIATPSPPRGDLSSALRVYCILGITLVLLFKGFEVWGGGGGGAGSGRHRAGSRSPRLGPPSGPTRPHPETLLLRGSVSVLFSPAWPESCSSPGALPREPSVRLAAAGPRGTRPHPETLLLRGSVSVLFSPAWPESCSSPGALPREPSVRLAAAGPRGDPAEPERRAARRAAAAPWGRAGARRGDLGAGSRVRPGGAPGPKARCVFHRPR